jgi:hypothetical protein
LIVVDGMMRDARLDGMMKGATVDVIRHTDGSIKWLRVNSRILKRQA